MFYPHGGYDDIFPMIEEALQEKKVGESVVVKMQPDDAFGEYDAELIQIEPRSAFPKELQIGMQFEGLPEGGDEDEVIIYRVTEIADDRVVLDGNHPLGWYGARVYLYGDGGASSERGRNRPRAYLHDGHDGNGGRLRRGCYRYRRTKVARRLHFFT